MQSSREMQQGWEFATNAMGAEIAARMGKDYIDAIEEAIRQLEDNINNHAYRNLAINQLQGYMLEEWVAGTFNIDAIAADSDDRARVLHSLFKDSVDIQLDSGKSYSAKSYSTGEQSAKAQAKVDPETGKASYQGQGRVVPEDHVDRAKAEAHRQALRNKPIRENVADAYADTEKHLTDRVQNDEGVTSQSASRKKLERIARESKEQNFKAKNHDITAEDVIKTEYLLRQALKAGYTTAVITAAVQLAPEIYKAIDFLIKTGEIDVQQIKAMGPKGISAGAEGFLRGSIASALYMLCEEGHLGEALKGADPTIVGVAVALILQTVKNSILVAAGRMTSKQMGAAFVDTVVVSGGYLIGAKIGGIIGQALGFELPALGYLLGSLLGTSFCVVYNIGKKKFISFCVDSGFTCFGLVDQNYVLPEEVLDELGVETIPVKRIQVKTTSIPTVGVKTADVEKADYETIDITVLKRGVIGVNTVGYVKN